MLEKEMISQYGSPVYVYEEEILNKKVTQMLEFAHDLENRIGARVKMHYSTKANANLHILKIINSLGMAADSMSPVELELTKRAGFKLKDILYVCNNVSREEMKAVVDQGILLCLDSVKQVEMLGQVRPNTNIMIRVNPETRGVGLCDKVITSGKEARFGILEKDFSKLFEVINKYNLNIIGVHEHLGSSFLDEDIEQYIEGISAGLEIIRKNFPNIKILDLGGGFGVPYKENEKELDLSLLSEKLSPVLSEFVKNTKVEEVKFEPGRYVVCEASYILGTVNSIKETYDKTWTGTDIGMNVLIRPSMYDAYHKIEIIKEDLETEYIVANIAGNVCESSDILGKDRKVLKPEIGDVVKVYNTGAYGYSMSSDYTGRLRVAEVLVGIDGNVSLIRKAQTIEDIINKF